VLLAPSNLVSGRVPENLWDAESRFSQLLYHGQTLVVQKLTESRFGNPKFGIPIEIRSSEHGIRCAMLLGAGLCGAGRAHAAAPGSGGRGRSALGCARCLRERGGGAVPCIAGFQSVGVEVRAAAARVECGWGGVAVRGVVGGFDHRRGGARG